MEQPRKQVTLAELLIAVALVVLLAAIVLPNVMRSEVSANEASAVGSIASINRAEVSYQTANPTIGFASSLETLGPNGPGDTCQAPTPSHACLIEEGLARAAVPGQARNGYWFRVSAAGRDRHGAVSEYVAGTAATLYKKTGLRDFCSQEDGVVRYRDPGRNSAPAETPAQCAAMPVLQ
ncbi:MAG: pili assembly chaperone [Acidobacteria bacterium]|nr:pili assembly chaperone [Acidobacteriota bacterium]